MKFDKVLYNANIITMDETVSRKNWVGIKDGKIAALGSGVDYPKDAAELVDLKGATMLPGLYDCHNHVVVAGLRLNSVDLGDAGSIEEVLRRMKKACDEAAPGAYVYGSNWVTQSIKENRYPTAEELDAISGDHVIMIIAGTLHGCGCNSKGMQVAAVPEDLPGVEKINGKPCGSYTSDESSFLAVANILGSLSDDDLWKFISDCAEYAASQGITGMHGLFGQFVKDDRDVDLILQRGHTLPIDMTVFYQTWDVEKARKLGLKRVGGCLTLDGATGEYTMANFEPYVTAPALRGVLYHNDDEVYKVIKAAHANNMQCSMHTVGERAIDQLIYAYHRVITEDGPKDLRHRIEHLDLPTDEQIKMAKKLNLVISMQPGFTYQWNDLFCQVLGQDRGDKMDPFNRVIAAGLVVCAGSDCPVTPIEPLVDIAHCVNGKEPIRRTRTTDALKMHTIWGAYAIGAEASKGSLEVGKDADITVIDKDPYVYEASPELFDMKVLLTMNKGKVTYAAK